MHVSRFGPAGAARVLLLHGGGVAGWMWDSLVRSLEETYSVLVPDLPGHGASADEPYRSHATCVAELAEVLSSAGGDDQPAAVIGFSLGAQLTIELASQHPDLIDRAIVVSAQAKPLPLSSLTLGALAVTAPLARKRWFARVQARELSIPPDLLDAYLATSAGLSKQTLLAAVGENLRYTLPLEWSAFPGRALVMVGSRERTLMRDSAAAIHGDSPRSELEVVDGCRHGIPLERPAWFNARVADWLGR